MCGIAGFLADARFNQTRLLPVALSMADAIRHRGPDDNGVWTDPHARIALAQRRLSIIDLSPAGHQPMVSASGRYVIVFNGEIYNFSTLRAELETAGTAPAWRGHSDTEVLLALIEARGVRAALQAVPRHVRVRAVDTHERTLVLARDRLGEKRCTTGVSAEASPSAPNSRRCARIRMERTRRPRGAGPLHAAQLRARALHDP